MQKNIIKILFAFLLITSSDVFAQDSTKVVNEKRLVLNPKFFSVQVDATTLLFINEISGHIDYDVFSSENTLHSFGMRVSIEHYSLGSFAGSTIGSPFTNYNLYARHSIRGSIFWFDLVGGCTYYTTSASMYRDNKLLLRGGFEVGHKFIFSNVGIGLVLKASTSFKSDTGFLGLGITFGFYNIE